MVYVKKDGNESKISTKRPAVRRRATRAARVKLTLDASSLSASRQVSPRRHRQQAPSLPQARINGDASTPSFGSVLSARGMLLMPGET